MGTATRVLLVGGTGIISSATARAAVARGLDVTVLTRGVSDLRPLPDGVRVVHADGRDPSSVREALGDATYDAVVDFVAFTPEHVASAVELWRGRTGQYVFISSASAYLKPPTALPVTESTPLRNPWWQYSRDKIACEDLLLRAFRDEGFPVTVVRPSHTYDAASCPTLGGWTDLHRMLRGDPVVVHGDGTSLWTITHHTDVAAVLVGLLDHPRALGEAFHITGDEAPTWDAIYRELAAALGVEPRLVHVTSDAIAAAAPDLGPGLLGDRTHSMVFDNAKARALAPAPAAPVTFRQGARQIAAWFREQLASAPERVAADPELDAVFDALVARHG